MATKHRQRALTAYYDPKTGELTKVAVSKTFTREMGLLKVDVLQDLHQMLTVLLRHASAQFRDELLATAAPSKRKRTK